VHDEILAKAAEEAEEAGVEAPELDDYTSITVAQPLKCPSIEEHLATANELPRGEGRQDYYEAASVALDLLMKTVAERHLEKVAKRLVVLSDFEAYQVRGCWAAGLLAGGAGPRLRCLGWPGSACLVARCATAG
jgi:hypothetical protein